MMRHLVEMNDVWTRKNRMFRSPPTTVVKTEHTQKKTFSGPGYTSSEEGHATASQEEITALKALMELWSFIPEVSISKNPISESAGNPLFSMGELEMAPEPLPPQEIKTSSPLAADEKMENDDEESSDDEDDDDESFESDSSSESEEEFEIPKKYQPSLPERLRPRHSSKHAETPRKTAEKPVLKKIVRSHSRSPKPVRKPKKNIARREISGLGTFTNIPSEIITSLDVSGFTPEEKAAFDSLVKKGNIRKCIQQCGGFAPDTTNRYFLPPGIMSPVYSCEACRCKRIACDKPKNLRGKCAHCKETGYDCISPVPQLLTKAASGFGVKGEALFFYPFVPSGCSRSIFKQKGDPKIVASACSEAEDRRYVYMKEDSLDILAIYGARACSWKDLNEKAETEEEFHEEIIRQGRVQASSEDTEASEDEEVKMDDESHVPPIELSNEVPSPSWFLQSDDLFFSSKRLESPLSFVDPGFGEALDFMFPSERPLGEYGASFMSSSTLMME